MKGQGKRTKAPTPAARRKENVECEKWKVEFLSAKSALVTKTHLQNSPAAFVSAFAGHDLVLFYSSSALNRRAIVCIPRV